MSNDPDMRGDLAAAVQMLAADNARMCDIVVAADRLAETLARMKLDAVLRCALDNYRATRNGQ